ncbi:MAG: translation initiation factor IF-3 [Nitrospiraceae bacterium]|nr:MAG: translation initiation factor IF-3 [Nitrospiraceae bacterium]
MTKKLRINRWIRASEVRVIDDEGNQLGILNIHVARKHAVERDLDLVEVAPEAKPPVCKIMDYGKYRYQQAKKNTTKQKSTPLKEVKVRPRINEHDYLFKMRNASKFLEHGHKVKITMQFRGREIVHKELGEKIFDRITKDLEEVSNVEARPKMEGNRMIMVMSPK